MFECMDCGTLGKHVTDRCEKCHLTLDLEYAVFDGRLTPEQANKILADVGYDSMFDSWESEV